MAGSFKTIITGNQQLDRIQQNIAGAFNSLTGPFLGGNLVSNVSLKANTPLSVSHGLSRQPTVWTLTDINAAANVYRTAWDSNSITLEASANCVVSVWVN